MLFLPPFLLTKAQGRQLHYGVSPLDVLLLLVVTNRLDTKKLFFLLSKSYLTIIYSCFSSEIRLTYTSISSMFCDSIKYLDSVPSSFIWKVYFNSVFGATLCLTTTYSLAVSESTKEQSSAKTYIFIAPDSVLESGAIFIVLL